MRATYVYTIEDEILYFEKMNRIGTLIKIQIHTIIEHEEENKIQKN